MKQIRLHIGMIAVLLTFMLTACTDCIVDNETSSNEAEDGYYTAHFNIAIPSFEKQTATRSTVYMNEGIRSKDDLIKMVEAGASRIGTSSGTKLVDSILE